MFWISHSFGAPRVGILPKSGDILQRSWGVPGQEGLLEYRALCALFGKEEATRKAPALAVLLLIAQAQRWDFGPRPSGIPFPHWKW